MIGEKKGEYVKEVVKISKGFLRKVEANGKKKTT